jgi:SAM-dependent methyltransferase
MEYKVHDVQWTDEKVKRFWDFYNNYPAFESLWFSKAVGKGIIKFVQKFFPIKGSVLDYGIGKGHFAAYLLEDKSIELSACDFSQETVNNINEMYKVKPNFKGCYLVQGFPSIIPAEKFDVVFLIESIEHLTENYLLPTIAEANRILKKGGKLVITTPNNEDLSHQHVICPDCGGVFHRVQHVNTFTAQSLNSIVMNFGFNTIHCGATDFHEHDSKGLTYKIRNTVKKFLQSAYSAPHLIYIGQKQ